MKTNCRQSRSFRRRKATQVSIFGYLAGRGNETMLDVTYRLNDVLTEWPSRTFYRNELKSSEEAAKRRLNLSPETTRWDFVWTLLRLQSFSTSAIKIPPCAAASKRMSSWS
jgi:hypothetical protein